MCNRNDGVDPGNTYPITKRRKQDPSNEKERHLAQDQQGKGSIIIDQGQDAMTRQSSGILCTSGSRTDRSAIVSYRIATTRLIAYHNIVVALPA